MIDQRDVETPAKIIADFSRLATPERSIRTVSFEFWLGSDSTLLLRAGRPRGKCRTKKHARIGQSQLQTLECPFREPYHSA